MSELRPLTGKVKRRKFLVLDVESKDDDTQQAGFTRPFMCGTYDGECYEAFFDSNAKIGWEERYFRVGGCVDSMMRSILTKEYAGYYIYAHNAGRFDYLFLLPWLMQIGVSLGFQFSVVPVASSIQMLVVWKGTMRWTFLDSLKLIPTSLDKAAKSFKLAGKKKHDLHVPETEQEAWKEYNRVDCEQLYQVLERFHHYVENVLGGEVGITAPSTAIKLYRRKYLKHSIPRGERSHDFVRSGYFGGRVEVFRTHGEGLYYFDINSSYPRAMCEPMPAGDPIFWEGKPPSRFQEEKIGFVEAEVEVLERTHIPVLPIKTETGKLIFPVGRLRGVWDWAELSEAMKHGARVVRWMKSVWYDQADLFSNFVLDLYKYRDTSRPDYDEGLAAIVKILLNASYGKFGMKTLRKKIYLWNDPDLPSNAVPAYPDPECTVWYAEEESDAPYVMPQISAHVTSLARIRLHRAMMTAVDLGGFVCYSDTDSVITNVQLPTGSALGELKNEFPEYGGKLKGEFLGPKLYLLKHGDDFKHVKAKGLESALKTEDTIRLLADGYTVFQDRLEKVGTLARTGFTRGPRMRTVPRKIQNEDSKRLILSDGTTRPLSLRMW